MSILAASPTTFSSSATQASHRHLWQAKQTFLAHYYCSIDSPSPFSSRKFLFTMKQYSWKMYIFPIIHFLWLKKTTAIQSFRELHNLGCFYQKTKSFTNKMTKLQGWFQSSPPFPPSLTVWHLQPPMANPGSTSRFHKLWFLGKNACHEASPLKQPHQKTKKNAVLMKKYQVHMHFLWRFMGYCGDRIWCWYWGSSTWVCCHNLHCCSMSVKQSHGNKDPWNNNGP